MYLVMHMAEACAIYVNSEVICIRFFETTRCKVNAKEMLYDARVLEEKKCGFA